MGPLQYILDKDRNPVAIDIEDEHNLCVWGEWMADLSHRRVRESTFNGCWISTVFLGIDHNFRDGPPVLFETMIFTKRKGSYKKINEYQWRYCTWHEAQAGHNLVSRMVKHKNLTQLCCL